MLPAPRSLSSASLLLLLLTGVRLGADTVTLRNGREFRDVVAVETEHEVRIQMAGGEVGIPRPQVLRVEAGPAALREYVARRTALRSGASAAQWLELARWAKAQDLDGAAREAALQAAALDPALPGLAPLLSAMGFVRDAGDGSWLEQEEAMRRKGLVLDDGVWVTPEQQFRREEARQRNALMRDSLAATRQAAPPESYDEMPAETGYAPQPVPAGGYGLGGYGWPWWFSPRVVRVRIATPRPRAVPPPVPTPRPRPLPRVETDRLVHAPR